MKTSIVICASWMLGAMWSLVFAETDSEMKKVGLVFISVAVLTGLQLAARGEWF